MQRAVAISESSKALGVSSADLGRPVLDGGQDLWDPVRQLDALRLEELERVVKSIVRDLDGPMLELADGAVWQMCNGWRHTETMRSREFRV